MPSQPPIAPQVRDNQAENRFEIVIEGKTSMLVYQRSERELVLLHTNVPEPLRGKGIATRLATAAMEDARSRHTKVVVRCPFIAGFLDHHPEYSELAKAE
jgi:predicted GNAT family acetyltransferase